jgi:shikimate kinase
LLDSNRREVIIVIMNENVGLDLDKPIVMVGLMGAGKTSVGRALSRKLGIPFVDSDKEIEAAAGCSVVDIFSMYGEEEFRRVEQRVISRLLETGPLLKVISTGEGAFITPAVREMLAGRALTIWLKADLNLLVKRTNFRNTRPQLLNADSKKILSQLIDERYKIYAGADITVVTNDESLQRTLGKVINAISNYKKVEIDNDRKEDGVL